MSKQIYHWKRFWCPRTAQINLGNRGYLVDPKPEWGKHYNPELVTLEAIADVPCLVLLGEPGIGKSQEIENLRCYTETKTSGDQDVFELNLRSYTSLKEDLFRDEKFIAWKDGTHRLYLFLDSLDEGLLEIPALATQLVDEFKKKKYCDHIDRLYLRITCRTAVFPKILEEGLEELWGKSNVRMYELAPLRAIDVQIAVTTRSLEADIFLKQIEHRNVVPLAIKPISLEFLLGIFEDNDGQISADLRLVDLYEKGCRYLCKEQNLSRIASRRDGQLEEGKRFIIAARIAAVMVFARRSAIWTSPSSGNDSAKDVLRRELCIGNEDAYGRPFPVTETAITEVLDTGLFSAHGSSNRMGWAHQTYTEFLAAGYLKQHNLNLSQILNLIIHPDRRVVPQLQETAAWLASMIPEVFQEIMKTDPDVLLQSDISTIDDENKAQLVESLLRFHNEEKLKYDYRRYSNLNYPELAVLLESYIRDSSKNQWSRLVAIDIAQNCDVKEVQDILADIALDPAQVYVVRIHAAHTIWAIGNETTKARLKPLAVGEIGDDPDNELKGYALRAVWSQHITVEELLDHLSQPKQKRAFPTIGGAYQDFISTEFVERLRLPNLLVMLKWLEQLPRRCDLHYPFGELADSVMLKAWQNLNEPGVLEMFASVAIVRLKQHDGILGDRPHQVFTRESSDRTRDDDVEPLLRGADGKRRQLIKAIVLLISEPESDFPWLPNIVCSEDILWAIERTTSAESLRVAGVWVKLLRQALTWHNLCWKNTKHVDAILEARNISSAMQSGFEIEIELDSEKAEKAKASYLQCQNLLKPSEPEPTLDPPPKQRLLAALENAEAGQPQLWWQIVVAMTLRPTSKQYIHNHIFESDITRLPGWEEAEVNIKARIVEAAKNYLDTGDPGTQTCLGTNNFSHPPFAGYQALYLLAKQEPDFISKISTDTWTKWIPIILKSMNFPHKNTKSKEDNICREIVRTAYQSASNELIETLVSLMVHNNYQSRTFYLDDIYRLTNELLDQCLASLIIGRVSDENLNAGMLEVLLTDLFNQDVDKAKEIAKSFLAAKVPVSGEVRNKAIVATRLLITSHPDDSTWSVLWSSVKQDHKFGREVLEAIAQEAASRGHIEQQLKEDYLADLYIFLSQQYPEIKQPEPETQDLRGVEAQMLGEFSGVRMWKNYIPQRLQARGTPEACDALQKIIRELPEQKNQLQPWLLEAERLARCNTWEPPKPGDILQLVINREPSNLDLSNQLNVIKQKMSEQPSIQIGSISGGINNFTPNQGTQSLTQIEIQNNYATDRNLLQTIQDLLQHNTDLKNFITDLETQNPTLLTEAEAETARDKAITNLQNNNSSLWKNIRAQMRTFKRQLLNPERHLQATKSTIVEVTKAYWEKSLIAKAIITYIDKLSETPDQGA